MLGRLRGPGFFRLMLALIVFASHSTRLGLGFAAVYIFFTLSGYWICTMWTMRYSKTHSPYMTYLVSRLWRLLPVFLLCSAIAWALLIWKGNVPSQLDWPHEIVSNLLIFGYHSLSFQPIVPAWSLDVEVQFYFIAPLLVLLMINRSVWILAACTFSSLSAYLLNDNITVAPYLVFFAIGVASASSAWKPGPRLAWGSLCFTLFLIIACLAGPFRGIIRPPSDLYSAFYGPAEVMLALLTIPWAIYTTAQKDTRLDGMFGDLSYIVYLIHEPILQAMNTEHGSYHQWELMVGEALAIVLLGSVLIWATFDHPINRIRSRWVTGRMYAPELSKDLDPSVRASN